MEFVQAIPEAKKGDTLNCKTSELEEQFCHPQRDHQWWKILNQ
jgi:hypothetical protein